MEIAVKPAGFVRGGRGTPEDDNWGTSQATIELDATRDASALEGLTTFSHVEIIFMFDRVPNAKIEYGARHPRERMDWPLVGIFAQRGKNRPNRIGTTVCRVVSASGLRLDVEGLDAIEGTPVLDIKPYMSGFAPRGDILEPAWAREIMKENW